MQLKSVACVYDTADMRVDWYKIERSGADNNNDNNNTDG